MKKLNIYAVLGFPVGGGAFKAMLKNRNGEMQSVDRDSHPDVGHDPRSFTFIGNWFSAW